MLFLFIWKCTGIASSILTYKVSSVYQRASVKYKREANPPQIKCFRLFDMSSKHTLDTLRLFAACQYSVAMHTQFQHWICCNTVLIHERVCIDTTARMHLCKRVCIATKWPIVNKATIPSIRFSSMLNSDCIATVLLQFESRVYRCLKLHEWWKGWQFTTVPLVYRRAAKRRSA